MESIAAILVFGPVLLTAALSMGIDPLYFWTGNGSEPDDWPGNTAIWHLPVYYCRYCKDQFFKNGKSNVTVLCSTVWCVDSFVCFPADWNMATFIPGIK